MEEMEITRLRHTLSGFDGVWDRVGGSEIPGAGSRPDVSLKHLINGEHMLARMLFCLARIGGHSAVLPALASAAAGRAARLRGEWFLEKGECYPPPKKRTVQADGRLCALRDTRNAALALTESYRAAARSAPEDARCLYEEFARQTEQTACRLRMLILACFA